MSEHVCGDSGGWAATAGRPCERPVPEEGDRCPYHPRTGEPAQNGRPSTYDPDIATEVCRRMAAGEKLNVMCREEERLPPASTIRSWAYDDRDDFFARYVRARELQADYWAEEAVEVADDGRNDTYVDEDGVEQVNHDVIQRSRLRVDTRKWITAKLAPRRYGKRVAMEHSGPDGGPIETKTEVDLSQLSDDDLRLLKQLRQRASIAGNGAGAEAAP